MIFWLTVSTNEKSTRLCHKWNEFCLFLVHVRLCVIVIGGETSQKQEMDIFRSHDSLISQSPVYHNQKQKLSILGLYREYSASERRFSNFYSRRIWKFCWLKGNHTFHFGHVGQYTPPITSRIDYCVCSKIKNP